jgi:hypothetical protein
MTRRWPLACGLLALGLMVVSPIRSAHAQGDGGYRLVADWPKLPGGMYFGLKEAPPGPAERDAQAAARRARGDAPAAGGGGGGAGGGGPQNQPGI